MKNGRAQELHGLDSDPRNKAGRFSSTFLMDSFIADLNYALRAMRRNPGFTAIALAALAIGIGANTAIFTVVNAVLLQPLPYPQPDRIMKLARQYPTGTSDSNSIPKYMVWRKNDVFESMALYDFGAIAMNLGRRRSARPGQGRPRLGGLLQGVRRVADGRAQLHRSGGPPARAGGRHHQLRLVAVALRRRPATSLGRPLLLNGTPYTIVGIMPNGFQAAPEADLWIPLQADPNSTNQGHYLRVGRPVEAGHQRRRGAGADENPRRAIFAQLNPQVDGQEGERRRRADARGDDGRRANGAAGPVRRRRARAADRVRQRGQPAAGARGGPAARAGDPRGDRRRVADASSGSC